MHISVLRTFIFYSSFLGHFSEANEKVKQEEKKIVIQETEGYQREILRYNSCVQGQDSNQFRLKQDHPVGSFLKKENFKEEMIW